MRNYLSSFDYALPRELIAQYPLKRREEARLLVVDRKGQGIGHHSFPEIKNYLQKDDVLILNDTKVLTCRLKGRKTTGGKVEALLLSRKKDSTFRALIKPSRTKKGEQILFADGRLPAVVSAKNEITFRAQDISSIYRAGAIPLPPYIKREAEDQDKIYYQTVYAKREGAVAAPTAGLHFTSGMLGEIAAQGTAIRFLTLHVGYATFKPVKCEDITRHRMEAERYEIPAATLKKVAEAKKSGGRIFAAGTTSARALESYGVSGKGNGAASLFIYPGYKFRVVDCLLTNFHFPRTTLFMLTCALAGTELAQRAYRESIDKKYRFYSYGDAMLIV